MYATSTQSTSNHFLELPVKRDVALVQNIIAPAIDGLSIISTMQKSRNCSRNKQQKHQEKELQPVVEISCVAIQQN